MYPRHPWFSGRRGRAGRAPGMRSFRIHRSLPMTSRRTFLRESTAAAAAIAFPLVAGAQPKPLKVGILHPVTGALAFSGQQCREGALMAIEDINKTGIRSLGNAKLEVL